MSKPTLREMLIASSQEVKEFKISKRGGEIMTKLEWLTPKFEAKRLENDRLLLSAEVPDLERVIRKHFPVQFSLDKGCLSIRWDGTFGGLIPQKTA